MSNEENIIETVIKHKKEDKNIWKLLFICFIICYCCFVELEKGLDRKIDQMYDPQYAPTCRPIFYMYMIQGDT